jgi:hypothetical protein
MLVFQVFGFVEEVEPVVGFVGFFEGDREFMDEVGFAFSLFGFSD